LGGSRASASTSLPGPQGLMSKNGWKQPQQSQLSIASAQAQQV
jgi:hypothetical protein